MTISWPQRSFLESPLFLNIFFIILILPVALIFSQYGPPCRVTTSPLKNKGGQLYKPFNNWFIRQRAFIEIRSTQEVWRA